MELTISKTTTIISSRLLFNAIIYAPVVAHAAVCLLAQALVGWPVSVPRRLVADLAQWVINRIAQLQLDSEVTGDAKTSTSESPAVIYLMNCTNDSFSPLVELIDSVAELARLKFKIYYEKKDEISSLIVKTDSMLRKIPGLMA
ncbi:unnamed protein product [Protopolystoma xenopodis]|uniref:Uncharacterized protein n=1 Tax=Protopolystoma xenopodis TaxID=117903 RepID=A0A448X4Z5_9PLAT|nr:unnamed protein product [Protopolystoma xenopodis]